MTKDEAIGYVMGFAVASFVIAFLIIGIIYLIGWRQSPKWKKRFWWMTFAVAGLMSLAAKSLLFAIIFWIVSAVIYIVKRGG